MRILFVSPGNSPFNPRQGSEQRSNLLLRSCLLVGSVDVVTFCHDVVDDALGANVIFAKQMDCNAFGPWNRKDKIRNIICSIFPSRMTKIDREKERILDSIIHRSYYDAIVVRYAFQAINCGLYKYSKRLIVDVDDNPSTVIKLYGGSSRGSLFGRCYYFVYSKNVDFAMKLFCQKIKTAFFSNRNNAKYYKSIFLPNVSFDEDNQMLSRDYICDKRLLFVGDMKYPANISSIWMFLGSVYPILKEKYQNLSLHIVGQVYDYHRKIFEEYKGVKVMGFVPSLKEEYAEAEIVILPMIISAGTCIKFLEAVQYGRPIVSSIQGYNGYEDLFKSGQDCFAASGVLEMSKDICELFNNKELQKKMALSAFEKLKNYSSKDKFYRVVQDALVS